MEDNERPETPVNASSARLGNRWKPGESGNPRGSKRGCKHKATLFAEALFSGECKALVRKTIELAKAGDVGALRLCLERLLPAIKSRPIRFELPELHTTSDYMVEICDKCEERGMQVPLILCAASPNGSAACARVYGDGAARDILAEHLEAEGLPMTCMVLDQNNEAARVTIAPGEILQFY